MLNFTPATAIPGSAAAETDAAQAAMRPLAGFGAGAFTCDGARVGSRANEMAASPARRRASGGAVVLPASRPTRRRMVADAGAYQPARDKSGTVGTSTVGTSTVRTSTVRTSTVGTGSAAPSSSA